MNGTTDLEELDTIAQSCDNHGRHLDGRARKHSFSKGHTIHASQARSLNSPQRKALGITLPHFSIQDEGNE